MERTRNYLKKVYKNFWKEKWRIKSIDEWDKVINYESGDSSKFTTFTKSESRRVSMSQKKNAISLLNSCLTKLWLEKKITKEENKTMKSMLESESESKYLALSIILSKVPNPYKYREKKHADNTRTDK